MKPTAITSSFTLDPVRVYSVETIEADVMAMHRRLDPDRAVDRDAWEIRHVIEGWGRTSRAELRCPATWWQHLKLALRTRWPRLFGRLAVRFDHVIAENGVLVAGLGPVRARHRVIPYHVPPSLRSYTDDPKRDEDDA